MAEKKNEKKPLPEREIIDVTTGTSSKSTAKKTTAKSTTKKDETKAAAATAVADKEPGEKKSSVGFRVAAIIVWLLGVGAMIGAIIMLMEGNMTYLIVGIVAAAVFCIIGSLLWKKANRISPCRVKQDGSFKSKLLTFLWNQMGVVATFVIFLPIGLFLLLKSDKLDKKQKSIVTIITIVLVALATTFSIDYNAPIAEFDESIPEDSRVYWTQFGYAYHEDVDCRAITRSLNIFTGTFDDAVEAGKDHPCSFCVGVEGDDVSDVDDIDDTTIDDTADDLPDDIGDDIPDDLPDDLDEAA